VDWGVFVEWFRTCLPFRGVFAPFAPFGGASRLDSQSFRATRSGLRSWGGLWWGGGLLYSEGRCDTYNLSVIFGGPQGHVEALSFGRGFLLWLRQVNTMPLSKRQLLEQQVLAYVREGPASRWGFLLLWFPHEARTYV
jgi:hypothetical protein